MWPGGQPLLGGGPAKNDNLALLSAAMFGGPTQQTITFAPPHVQPAGMWAKAAVHPLTLLRLADISFKVATL
jgi:hypothetical protein